MGKIFVFLGLIVLTWFITWLVNFILCSFKQQSTKYIFKKFQVVPHRFSYRQIFNIVLIINISLAIYVFAPLMFKIRYQTSENHMAYLGLSFIVATAVYILIIINKLFKKN